jgi:hypothetical protein
MGHAESVNYKRIGNNEWSYSICSTIHYRRLLCRKLQNGFAPARLAPTAPPPFKSKIGIRNSEICSSLLPYSIAGILPALSCRRRDVLIVKKLVLIQILSETVLTHHSFYVYMFAKRRLAAGRLRALGGKREHLHEITRFGMGSFFSEYG